MSKYYDFYKMCWDYKYVTDITYYQKAVVKGILTSEEFTLITGQKYN